MSSKLRELIKKVRSCKTAEEERSVINKESAEIRNMGKEQSDLFKSRNLAKCIFMHMLGYPTSFIQMTCVNLLASSKFTDKRIAYVALCVLMDERSEVLLLTSHTIKKDLESTNQYIVAVALNAIGEVCTADMCRETSSEVIKCLSNNNPYIKKKAALALTKTIRKCPELLDTVADKLSVIFEDKNHGVLLCGLALAVNIFKQEPSYIDKYKKYIPHMIRYLKNLSSTNYAPEYDINGVTDPFLQVKLLEILAQFGKNYPDENEDLNNLLASISTNTEANKNTGNAVLYELVRTIISIEASSGLKTLGSTILGKFLGHKENNYKYIALNTLQEVARTDLGSVQKHKNVILECLKDTDISIKRRSLDLVYMIINASNIKQIIKECLNFLLVAENEFKLELTTKICQSLEKYSPSLKWQIDTLIKMLCLAGNFISEETLSSIINLVMSIPELHLYSMFKIYIAMKSNLGQEGLIKLGVYTLGELGYMIIGNSAVGPDNETITVTEEEVVQLIDEINSRKCSPSLKEYLVNCYFKMIPKLSDAGSSHLKLLLEQETRSYHCEVQQRANEYVVFSKLASDSMKLEITKNIPVSKIVKESEVTKEIMIEEYEGDEDKNFNSLISKDRIGTVSPVTSFPINDQSSFKPIEKKTESKSLNLIDQFGDIFQTVNTPIPAPTKNLIPNLFDTNTIPNMNMNTIQMVTNVKSDAGNKPAQDLLSELGKIYSEPNVSSTTSNPNSSSYIGGMNMPIPNLYSMPQTQTSFPAMTAMGMPNKQQTIVINNNASVPVPSSGINVRGSDMFSAMNQIFKNAEITIFSKLVKSQDKAQVNGSFFISNNIDKQLSNVKINFLVKRHVTFKVLSTSGAALEPYASLGIKKEVTMTNNEVDKDIVIKINYSYTVDGRDVTDSFMYDSI